MELVIYKGFNKDFLDQVPIEPLCKTIIDNKLNVLLFDKSTIQVLAKALIKMDDNDEKWITYEEYTLIKTRVDDQMKDFGLKVTIIRNNLFPGYYEIPFEISDELAAEIDDVLNKTRTSDVSEECDNYVKVYNSFCSVGDKLFGSFYNYEDEIEYEYKIEDYYPCTMDVEESIEKPEYTIYVNNDIEDYLRNLNEVNVRSVSDYVETCMITFIDVKRF